MRVLLFIVAVTIAACIRNTHTDIEGVYLRESVGEYSRAWDTLMIYNYDSGTGTYQIRRKTGFIRFNEGVAQPKQWREEKMITLYDEATNQLMDKKTGRLFSFKEGALLFGTAAYKKAPWPPEGGTIKVNYQLERKRE